MKFFVTVSLYFSKSTRLYMYKWVCVGVCVEVNNEKESDSMEKN